MKSLQFFPIVVAACALLFSSPAGAHDGRVPSDAEIRKILVDRIDAQKQSVGIVVGVIEPSGRRIVAYGKLAKDDPRPLNGDTLYEIGSITKVFTSLLLADAVERGEVALTDPVGEVPAGQGQDARARRARDHAGGSGDAHLRPAADADELRAEGSGQSVRGLFRREHVRVSQRLSAHAGHRRASTSTRTSAPACSATRWRCGRARPTTRRSCARASWRRWG